MLILEMILNEKIQNSTVIDGSLACAEAMNFSDKIRFFVSMRLKYLFIVAVISEGTYNVAVLPGLGSGAVFSTA